MNPPALKLIVDCWEEIFEYLSFKDIHLSFSGTCKAMHKLAGHYFNEFYPEVSYQLMNRGEISYLVYMHLIFGLIFINMSVNWRLHAKEKLISI